VFGKNTTDTAGSTVAAAAAVAVVDMEVEGVHRSTVTDCCVSDNASIHLSPLLLMLLLLLPEDDDDDDGDDDEQPFL
jgi:hypothetical protein